MRCGLTAAVWPLVAIGLAACSHWPGFTSPPPPFLLTQPAPPPAFRLDGRISVKAGEESFSGGMVWQRNDSSEELLLRTPLGQGVAEISGGPAGMELKDAEGRRYHAPDADALVRQALGMELPLRGMASWVLGRPRPQVEYRASADADGHLGELEQDGWQISFSRYQSHHGYMLPGKLVAKRDENLEVRLVVDSWELP